MPDSGVPIIRTVSLATAPGTFHGFFGRRGGRSTGLYESLNCGWSALADETERLRNVPSNRENALIELTGGLSLTGQAPFLLTLSQVHGTDVVTVSGDSVWGSWGGPKADAMVTKEPGLVLGILTADCAPVLLCDPQALVIGAAHAGWKGALAGVIEATIAAMETLGAQRQRIVAAVGPCISQANYEVGAEFLARFVGTDAGYAKYFVPGADAAHHRFDLQGFVADKLTQAGACDVDTVRGCTYAQEEDFFSFRRATHRGEKDYGRQISTIMLR